MPLLARAVIRGTAMGCLALAIRCGPEARLMAQAGGLDPDRTVPEWLRNWSPLASWSDFARRLPGTGAAVSPLFYGAPRVGLFWTTGNPAALASDIPDGRTDLFVGYGKTTGEYHRPLDPGGADRVQFTGQSWQRFKSGLAMIGRVVADGEDFDAGTPSNSTEPYGASPLVTVDTSAAAVGRTRARLEGGLGWQTGSWGFGVTAGYEGRDHTSTASGLVRKVLQVQPGVVLGVSRRIGTVEVGAHGKYRYQAETIRLTERSAEGLVQELRGYAEDRPISIRSVYDRRRDQQVFAGGLGARGSVAGALWTLFGEAGRLEDRLSTARVNDPAEDRWDSRSWALGGAVQRPLGGNLLLSAQARYTSLRGDADLATDSVGTVFEVEEQVADGEVEARLLPGSGGWSAVATLGLRFARRLRNDVSLQLAPEVRSVTPALAIEVGRSFSARWFASLGAAIANYRPEGTIPDPSVLGPAYREYVAGEMAMLGTGTTPVALSALVRWQAATRTELWLAARGETLSPSGSYSTLPLLPSGNRTSTSLSGGVTMRSK